MQQLAVFCKIIVLAIVAQSAVQLIRNQQVGGSNPPDGFLKISPPLINFLFAILKCSDKLTVVMIKSLLEYLFERILGTTYNLLSFMVIIIDSFFKNFPKGIQAIKKIILKQIYFSGYEALRLTIQLGFFMGIVIVTQIASYVKGLGGVNLIGKIIAVALIREVMPLFMAIILIARSGTAITSELGLMKVNGEITALKALGIEPMYYIVFTRISAFVISAFTITLLASFVSVITGSMALFLFEKVAFSDFYEALFLNLGVFDLVLFVLKSISFGFAIPLVCCFYGLSIKKSVTEVPQMSTKAVLSSFFYVFLLNVLLDFLVLIWQ